MGETNEYSEIAPRTGYNAPGLFPRLTVIGCVFFVCVVAGVHTVPQGESCDTLFGSVIGTAFGVSAFSNCNGEYISNESNFVNISGADDVYTGMPWQCVEYARRFLVVTPPHVAFGSVDGASDIWPMTTVQSVTATNVSYKFLSFANSNTTVKPAVGDLIIYPIQPNGFPFGHVAVVVGVTQVAIQVAEQNWDSFVWAHVKEGFSREIELFQESLTGRWTVSDPNGAIVGWKRALVA